MGKKKQCKKRQSSMEETEEDLKKYAFGTEKGSVCAIHEKTAQIGGVPLEVVVDSGTSCNVTDGETWKMCKSMDIKCDSKD